MNYSQQDALKKLREARINASVAQKMAQRELEKAEAELDKWTRRCKLAIDANREDLIPHARYKKQHFEEVVSRFKNIVDGQTLQLGRIKSNFNSWEERISQEKSIDSLPEIKNNNILSDLNSIEDKCLETQINAEEVSQSYNTIEESIDDELKRLKSQLLNKRQYEAKEQTSELNQINRNSIYQNQVSQTSIYIQQPQQKNIGTGVAFISAGAIAGGSLSSTIGGMGLVGSFGGIGIGAAPVICAGAVTGAAAYGALQAIKGDRAAISAIAIGSIGGATASSFIGSMGLVAPKIGLAVGIGTLPMAAVGGVVGLAAYGVAKMLNETAISETPIEAFERMEEKILEMDFYSAAKQELQEFLSGKDLNPQFATLEIEDELQSLKKQLLND